jgi:hypothetical protein
MILFYGSRRNGGNIFIVDLVLLTMFETLVMADRISNYATASGVIVGLGVLLFAVRTHRKKEDRERKVKYGSNGKPISG